MTPKGDVHEPARLSDVVRQIAVVAALAATLVMNALANALPIGGRTTGEISNEFPVLFTPAGYTFSIWTLIYLSLIAYAIVQALPSRRVDARLRRIGWLFVASCAFNIGWIFVWHHLLIAWSMLLMLGILISLILIYLRLDVGRVEVAPVDYWTTRFPFSLYLAWITVATVANATILLFWLGWRGGPLPEPVWGAIAVAAATAVGFAVLWKRKDVVFAVVLVWALVGVSVGQSEHPTVWGTAVSAALLLAVAAIWALFTREPQIKDDERM